MTPELAAYSVAPSGEKATVARAWSCDEFATGVSKNVSSRLSDPPEPTVRVASARNAVPCAAHWVKFGFCNNSAAAQGGAAA